MKFGLMMPHHGAFASPVNIARMARTAESVGFDSIWLSDHIIIPRPLVDRFSDTFYELFTTLGYLAGITERVKLGTTVLVLPYRHPVTLAKQVATLDQLSGGRTILGAAFGWAQDEYAILDVPYEQRGARADEMLDIMNHLWRGNADNSFDGAFYQFEDFAFAPLPVQSPRPPIWIGGNNERALQRTVQYGDGWHPITSASRPGSVQWGLADLQRLLTNLDEMAAQAGRDPASIARSLHAPIAFDLDATAFLGDGFGFVGSADHIRRNLDAARSLGIEHIILNCWYTIPGRVNDPSLDAVIATLERFIEQILPEYTTD